MKYTTRHFIVFSLGGIAVLASPAAARTVSFQRVFYSSNREPTPGGDVVSPHPFDAPLINDDGQIAFVRHYLVSQNTTTDGVYVGTAAGASLIARYGQSPPGQPTGVTYYSFGGLSLANGGNVAFGEQLLTRPGPGSSGVIETAYSAGPAQSTSIAAWSFKQAPGLPTGTQFNLSGSVPNISATGHVLFNARLYGTGVTSSTDESVFGGTPSAPVPIAREGAIAPGMSGTATYGSFGYLLVDGHDDAVFTASLNGPGQPAFTYSTIYKASLLTPNAVPTLIAHAGDPAPGLPSGVNYQALYGMSLSDDGRLGYGATLSGASVDASNNVALYAGPIGSPALVARSGDIAPGTGGQPYVGLSHLLLNRTGGFAYTATLGTSNDLSSRDYAIYAGSANSRFLVVRGGDAVPDLSPGYLFVGPGFPDLALNDRGTIVFGAGVTSDGGLTDTAGLFAYTPAGGLQTLLRKGDMINIGDGTFKQVAAFDMANPLFGVSGSSLSNDDVLVVSVTFTDGTGGIYRTVLPEPALGSAAILGCGLGLARRRR